MAAAADEDTHLIIFANARYELEHYGIIVTAVGVYEEGAAYYFRLENSSIFAQYWRHIRHLFSASPFTIVNNQILMIVDTEGHVILPNETYRIFMEAEDIVDDNDELTGFFVVFNRITIFRGTA